MSMVTTVVCSVGGAAYVVSHIALLKIGTVMGHPPGKAPKVVDVAMDAVRDVVTGKPFGIRAPRR